MLPSSKKVSASFFKTLMAKGRSFHDDFFSVRVFFEPKLKSAKFSVVVPKKIEKTSVGRNLMKRRLYSALRPMVRRSIAGSLVAIFVKKKFLAEDIDKIVDKIERIAKKSGVRPPAED